MDKESQTQKKEFEKKYNKIFNHLIKLGKNPIVVFKDLEFDPSLGGVEPEDFIPEIVRVNKILSINEYKIDLNNHRRQILRKLTINNEENRIDFLENILIKTEILENYIRIYKNKGSFSYLYRNYVLKDNKGKTYDELEEYYMPINDEFFFEELNEYSKAYYISIKQLQKDIKQLIKEEEETGKEKDNTNKLKVNLDVGELALLFKIMDDNKMLDIKTKTSLFRFLADNFQTRGKKDNDEQSASNIKNKFDTPDPKAIEFWDTKFVDFRQYIQKNK